MTEDEAKTKRCCGPEGCGWEGATDGPYKNPPRLCIGSVCMAWRRDESAPAERGTLERFGITHEDWYRGFMETSKVEEIQRAIQAAETDGWYAESGQNRLLGMTWNICRGSIPQGYCGLAGKP